MSVTEQADAIVLGAGVVGVATAYALARRGVSVVLIDREAGPARGASFANGAQLSYAYSDTLGGPALLRRLPALAFGADPMFRLKLSPDPELIAWGLKFIRACSARSQRDGTIAILTLALESRRAMHALLARHPIAFGHAVAGKMHLYFDRASLGGARDIVELKRAHGAVQHVLDAREARALEPALEDARGLEGVVYSPEDEVGDAFLFCEALTRILVRDYGVRTLFGTQPADVSFDAGGVAVRGTRNELVRGRTLVVAAGASAGSVLKTLGLAAPVQPLKGYSFTAPQGAHAPRVSITDTARKLVFCSLSGRMRVAGLAELGDRSTDVVPARLAWLVAAARESLPRAAAYDALDSSWAGLRPMSPDSVPVISRPRERVVLNIGHGMLGWTLAMGAGERAAELALQDLGTPLVRRQVQDDAA
jgi:D-amino-acid dehydrogenase